MKKNFLLFFLINISIASHGQTTITMQKENGVYVVPCTINGLKLKFIFDTGASDVSISSTEALFMLKNGYMSKDDILDKQYYKDANGDISEGTRIIIRKIEFAGLTLNDVQASVVHELSAPLLLGQTAMAKLGKFQFDPNAGTLTILNGANNSNANTNPTATKQTDTYHTTIVQTPKSNTNNTVTSTSLTPASFPDNCIYHSNPIPEDASKTVLDCNQLYYAANFSQCIQQYDLLIQKYPDYCVAFYNRGLAKYSNGDKTGAQSDWNKAIALGFNDAKSLIAKYFGN